MVKYGNFIGYVGFVFTAGNTVDNGKDNLDYDGGYNGYGIRIMNVFPPKIQVVGITYNLIPEFCNYPQAVRSKNHCRAD